VDKNLQKRGALIPIHAKKEANAHSSQTEIKGQTSVPTMISQLCRLLLANELVFP
jgi:hypothetical protein